MTRPCRLDKDEKYWVATSPQHQLRPSAPPVLIVCFSERRFPISPCDEGRKFARKATSLGVAMQVLPEPLDHGQINRELGAPSGYTRSVGDYIDRLVR